MNEAEKASQVELESDIRKLTEQKIPIVQLGQQSNSAVAARQT